MKKVIATEHEGIVTNARQRRLSAVRLLRQAKEFRHRDQKYDVLLDDESESVRLEALSYAVEDMIGLPETKVRKILEDGSELERRYALLILARNGQVKADEIESADLGMGEYAQVWVAACRYAVNPTLTGILRIFGNVFSRDLSLASLALNLTVTISNAIHRIVIYDLIKIIISSKAVPDNLLISLREALPDLTVRQSWAAIGQYRFKPGELSRNLS